jgi:ABC-type lipoprotein export system ATPase subunit
MTTLRADQPIIELDDVFVLYRGALRDVAALRGLSLTVASGERVVVHGPSGAGKSTFVQLITAALPPNAGGAILLGHDLGALDAAGRRQLRGTSIGIITQHSGDDISAELTCLQNVVLQPRLQGWSRARSMAAASAMLDAVGLAEMADRYPSGLSHGELQRVGIAAALAHSPTLIVADEPTGQLDTTTADAVFDLLRRLATDCGATLVLATHDETAGRIADRVLTITEGRLSSEKKADEDLPTVVVDRRGWLRLPPAEREATGIGTRASVMAAEYGVVIAAVSPPPATIAAKVARSSQAGAVLVRVDEATVVVDGTTVLAPTSIQLRRGEIHAIVGRSGSGKTTLLSLLTGWLAPTRGEVDICDTLDVAVCPAVPSFPDGLTVHDTLELTMRMRGREPDAVRLASVLAELGLADLRSRRTSELSGGERQRLALARCLVSDAALMVLDEPTSQLDPLIASRAIAALERAATSGHAIVCATHDQALRDRAHQVTNLGH